MQVCKRGAIGIDGKHRAGGVGATGVGHAIEGAPRQDQSGIRTRAIAVGQDERVARAGMERIQGGVARAVGVDGKNRAGGVGAACRRRAIESAAG
jgi:hypothetical protein